MLFLKPTLMHPLLSTSELLWLLVPWPFLGFLGATARKRWLYKPCFKQ